MADDPVESFELPTADEITTAHRLREFENKMFGDGHARHGGQIEKGKGSAWESAEPNVRAHHAAIEELIAAEQEHEQADRVVQTAHARLQTAIARVQSTEGAL